MAITSSQIGLLGQVLDVAALRHRVIAQNLANLNTPFYQRLALASDEGSSELSSTDGKPTVVLGAGGVPRADGNNLSIEQEMGDPRKEYPSYSIRPSRCWLRGWARCGPRSSAADTETSHVFQ